MEWAQFGAETGNQGRIPAQTDRGVAGPRTRGLRPAQGQSGIQYVGGDGS